MCRCQQAGISSVKWDPRQGQQLYYYNTAVHYLPRLGKTQPWSSIFFEKLAKFIAATRLERRFRSKTFWPTIWPYRRRITWATASPWCAQDKCHARCQWPSGNQAWFQMSLDYISWSTPWTIISQLSISGALKIWETTIKEPKQLFQIAVNERVSSFFWSRLA